MTALQKPIGSGFGSASTGGGRGVHRRTVLLMLVPVLMACGVSQVAATPEGLERSGLTAYTEGRFGDASQAFVEAIRASERVDAPDPGLGQLLSDLAWLYH
ncbi:MAG TPA: hypothetical protein VEU09_03250, partial [Candidatus Binatia bacterium]|nr:hypothetical protein [Candidatus Binatia bacterium]